MTPPRTPESVLLLLLVCGALLGSGCATQTPFKPDFLANDFAPSDIDTLTVMPAVDLRKDRSVAIEPKELQDRMLLRPTISSSRRPWSLEAKGYTQVVQVDSISDVASITEDNLAEPKPEWIKSLGPDAARWVLLFTLDDLVSASTFGHAITVKCSGYLFDKNTARLVWRHRAVMEFGAGGLVGVLSKSRSEKEVLEHCVARLMMQLPPRN